MQIIDADVVILCGVSGSGKTAFARLLQERGYHRISADEIVWQRYGGDFVSQLNQEGLQKVYAEAGSIINRLVVRQLEQGGRVVVDATMCRRSKRDEIAKLCIASGVDYIVLYMDTSEQLIRERLKKRQGQGPDDQIVTPDQLNRYLTNFEKPQPDEDNVIKASQILYTL